MLGTVLSSLLTGPLVNVVSSYLEKSLDVDMNKDKLRADLEREILSTIQEVTKEQGSVIKAELKSQDKLPRVWRAVAGTLFVFASLFFILIEPIAVAWFGLPEVPIKQYFGDQLNNLVLTCLGGYVGVTLIDNLANSFVRWRR